MEGWVRFAIRHSISGAVMSTSLAKREANRHNGKKGGVKTSRGRAITRFNALKHGILSNEVVIRKGDSQENPEAYLALIDGLQSDLQPVGMLEQTLVETVATCLWRKRRVLRFETGQIRQKLDNHDLHFEMHRNDDARSKEHTHALDGLGARRSSNALDEVLDAIKVLSDRAAGWDSGELWREDVTKLAFMVDGLMHYDDRGDGWSRGKGERLLQFWLAAEDAIRLVEQHRLSQSLVEKSRKSFIKALNELRREVAAMKERFIEKEQLDAESGQMAASLPSADALDKICRYETHLDRQLHRALHELRELQAARLGRAPMKVQVD